MLFLPPNQQHQSTEGIRLYLMHQQQQQQQQPFNGLFSRITGTRKVKPIWILLEQETVSGSGISWAICKSAPHSRQITIPVPTTLFLQAGCPSCHPTNSVKALKAHLVHQVHKKFCCSRIDTCLWQNLWETLSLTLNDRERSSNGQGQ